jgi:hypothetical protein
MLPAKNAVLFQADIVAYRNAAVIRVCPTAPNDGFCGFYLVVDIYE